MAWFGGGEMVEINSDMLMWHYFLYIRSLNAFLGYLGVFLGFSLNMKVVVNLHIFLMCDYASKSEL